MDRTEFVDQYVLLYHATKAANGELASITDAMGLADAAWETYTRLKREHENHRAWTMRDVQSVPSWQAREADDLPKLEARSDMQTLRLGCG